jgi:hypothetical protein
MFFFVWKIGNKFVSLPHNLLIKYEMIHYSNILPPIQCDSLIKRSIATLYGVLCLIEESFVLSIKEMGLLSEDITTMSESSTDSNFTTKSSTSDTITTTDTINSILANAFLYQNTPNPFNTTTEIKYFLPEGSTNAYIYVFNLQGNLLLTYNLSDNGFGSVIINGSSLNAGMYIYSLVVNGQEAETKRMILTK